MDHVNQFKIAHTILMEAHDRLDAEFTNPNFLPLRTRMMNDLKILANRLVVLSNTDVAIPGDGIAIPGITAERYESKPLTSFMGKQLPPEEERGIDARTREANKVALAELRADRDKL